MKSSNYAGDKLAKDEQSIRDALLMPGQIFYISYNEKMPGYVKIGVTGFTGRQVSARLADWQARLGKTEECLLEAPGSKARESHIHQWLVNHGLHVEGELFRYNGVMKRCIERLKDLCKPGISVE